MTIKERYDFVLKNISKQPIGTFAIYELSYEPDFFNDNEKFKENNGNYTFGIELTNKATNKDYKDYVEYVLKYTGMDQFFDLGNIEKDEASNLLGVKI